MEQIIKELTKDDILNDFHNIHMRNLISATINKKIYEEIIKHKGEKEIVGEKPTVIGQGADGRPMTGLIKIKAIDALLSENKLYEQQKRIVDVIEEIRKNG